MKIQSVEVFKLDIPLKDPMVLSTGAIWNLAKNVAVRITTDNDHVGYGVTSQVPWYHGMTQGMILDACQYLAPVVVGQDPTSLARIHDLVDRALPRAGPAKCAIDLALYDLLGKAMNQPAYALMGGRRRDSFPTTWTLPVGRETTWSTEETIAEARKKYDLGYRNFEVHVDKTEAGFEKDLARINAVIDACPGVGIDADIHRAWTVKQAIRAMRSIEKSNIWIEQPCETLREVAEVRGQVTGGILVDENCQTVADLIDVVMLHAADGICLKPIKAGGLYPSWQMSTISERFGLAVRIDGIPGESKLSNTASAHVALTLKQPILCGVMHHERLEYDFVKSGGIEFVDGQVRVTDAPGLGCEVDEGPLESVGYFN